MPHSPDADELAAIEAAVWRELAGAVQDKAHPWRCAVLATTDGSGADARTVVLREFDRDERALRFFADARSPKVRQVQACPQGMLVLWSPERGWQLRLAVQIEVQTQGLLVSSRWARLKMTPAAQDYLSPLPPGSPLDRPVPERGTREHFAVLVARIASADWLELSENGQRRARFDERGRRWLTP
jgi:hypothetical protein